MSIVYYCEPCQEARGWPKDLRNKREKRCNICGNDAVCFFRDSSALPAVEAPKELVMSKPEKQPENVNPSHFTIDDDAAEVVPMAAPVVRKRGRPVGSGKKSKVLTVSEVEEPTITDTLKNNDSLDEEYEPTEPYAPDTFTADEARALRSQLLDSEAKKVVADICRVVRNDPTASSVEWPLDRSASVRALIVSLLGDPKSGLGYTVVDDGTKLTITW